MQRLGGLVGYAGRRACLAALASVSLAGPASSESLEGAMVRAYKGNPQLNADRAGVRIRDEDVAIAQSGYRPTVGVSADIGVRQLESRQGPSTVRQATIPGGVGLTLNQILFNGFQTDNKTRRAESGVLSQREGLRFTENAVLFSAVQAYMNVLASTAQLELNRNNVEVLQEQLGQTRDRFNVGEVTRTDVAQSEARLAGARSQVSAAEAALRTNIGIYRQEVGVEPRQLAPGRPPDRLVPRSLDAAVAMATREHPQVLSALHAVDAAEAQVKVFEGQLYPQLSVQGTVQQRYDTQFANTDALSAAVVGRLTVPIYQGGQEYAQIRQAKEQVGEARIRAEAVRDQVRAQVVDFWGRLQAAKANVLAAQAQVQANEVALSGVREEARVGQRTTLDVLNAQQELLGARISLVNAQRDRVVFAYGVVQAVGALTVRYVGLPATPYSAKVHFDQVKDLWFGVGIPDGR